MRGVARKLEDSRSMGYHISTCRLVFLHIIVDFLLCYLAKSLLASMMLCVYREALVLQYQSISSSTFRLILLNPA